MDKVMSANLGQAEEADDHVKSALGFARVDKVIPAKLKEVPGLDAIVKDIVTHGTAIGVAVQALGAALDLDTSGDAVAAKKLTATPFDDAAIKKAVTKLGAAVAIGPLIDKFEHLFTDAGTQKKLRDMAKAKGLVGGVEDARGGLKSITPSTVAVAANIRGLIVKIEGHAAVAGSATTKKSLEAIEAQLTAMLDSFSKDILRLVAVFDKGIGATFS